MPAFNFNPSDAISGIPVYPDGEYEIQLGEPKTFIKKNAQTGEIENFGIRFKSKIVEGEYKDKPVFVNCYMDKEDSRNFSKMVQMAALGYTPKNDESEAKFNAFADTISWSFDPDNGNVGEGWQKMKGQHLIWTAKKGIDKDNNPQQKTVGYRPLVAQG